MKALAAVPFRLLAIAVWCISVAGCTLLTYDPPTPAALPAIPQMTAADAAIVTAAVSARLAGQGGLRFDTMLPGTMYLDTDSFTVCGQVRAGGGAPTFYIGYLSRQRSQFAIAGIASSGMERQAIIGTCIRNDADTTATAAL